MLQDNLRPDHYDDFVFYLTEVVKWYRDTHGLVFRYSKKSDMGVYVLAPYRLLLCS